jgi:hypothetical protein
MAYKDELSLLTGVKVVDLITEMRNELEQYRSKVGKLTDI